MKIKFLGFGILIWTSTICCSKTNHFNIVSKKACNNIEEKLKKVYNGASVGPIKCESSNERVIKKKKDVKKALDEMNLFYDSIIVVLGKFIKDKNIDIRKDINAFNTYEEILNPRSDNQIPFFSKLGVNLHKLKLFFKYNEMNGLCCQAEAEDLLNSLEEDYGRVAVKWYQVLRKYMPIPEGALLINKGLGVISMYEINEVRQTAFFVLHEDSSVLSYRIWPD